MQFNKVISGFAAAAMIAVFAFSTAAVAAPKSKDKAYDEEGFIRLVSGKSRSQVKGMLGDPVRKEQSVKPANAEKVVPIRLNNSTPTNVEMWYYNNIVRYDAKHTYNNVELTFVNDQCKNIAFFNKK